MNHWPNPTTDNTDRLVSNAGSGENAHGSGLSFVPSLSHTWADLHKNPKP